MLILGELVGPNHFQKDQSAFFLSEYSVCVRTPRAQSRICRSRTELGGMRPGRLPQHRSALGKIPCPVVVGANLRQ